MRRREGEAGEEWEEIDMMHGCGALANDVGRGGCFRGGLCVTSMGWLLLLLPLLEDKPGSAKSQRVVSLLYAARASWSTRLTYLSISDRGEENEPASAAVASS